MSDLFVQTDGCRGNFYVKKENFGPAMEAVQDLVRSMGGLEWVEAENVLSSGDFIDVLKECRHFAFLDADGNICALEFAGWKAGDDDALFHALAPFVVRGDLLYELRPGGYCYHYIFRDGGLEVICSRKQVR